MKPLDWHKKRHALGMSSQAELLLHLCQLKPRLSTMHLIKHGVELRMGSDTTLLKYLKWLARHNFISIYVDEQDSRYKICSITTKGIDYLEMNYAN